jgi:hypothetical protein
VPTRREIAGMRVRLLSQRRLLGIAAAMFLAAAGFATVAAAESPQNSQPPSISGTADVGQTLTGANGSWLFNDGSACTDCTYSFQWQRSADGNFYVDISGAAAQTYTVTGADRGYYLRVAVTATRYDCNAHGVDCRWVSVTAYSPKTSVVPGGTTSSTTSTGGTTTAATTTVIVPAPPTVIPTPVAPTLVSPPGLTLSMQNGKRVLSASPGSWNGVPALTYSYAWERCNRDGERCLPIDGATGATYGIGDSDIGFTLRVVVTASNSAGTLSAPSEPTSVIEPEGLIELAGGADSIPVSSVSAPNKLKIDRVSFAPAVVRSYAAVTLRLRVVDAHGYVVRGVRVTVEPVRRGQIQLGRARSTTVDGTVAVAIRPARSLALRSGRVLAVTIFADKPGDADGEVSATRVLRIPLGTRR